MTFCVRNEEPSILVDRYGLYVVFDTVGLMAGDQFRWETLIVVSAYESSRLFLSVSDRWFWSGFVGHSYLHGPITSSFHLYGKRIHSVGKSIVD